MAENGGLTPFPDLPRLRWRCRRGMRELDRMLEAFLEYGLGRLDAVERQRFAEILEFPDPDLHAYLVGTVELEDPELARIVRSIREALPA